MTQRVVRVGVAGATGYLGAELLRILARHPNVEIAALASTSQAGKSVGDILPHFRGVLEQKLVPLAPEAFAGLDAVFVAAPHGVALDLAPKLLAQGNRVIDLSGDHRLADAALAAKVYGKAPAPDVAKQVVYGLPELNAERIRGAKLVANPGCYPTASALAVLPLAKAALVEGRVIVSAMSGVSGAGREPSADLHYPEMNESLRAYKVGEHRHEPEIAQTIGAPVTFTPHIVPMNRGILATAHLQTKRAFGAQEISELYAKFYADAPCVRVVPHEPDVKHVRGTNFCDLRPHANAPGTPLIVTSAIDNLTKGGSGQAVQNLNLMFGLPETAGLPLVGGGI